MTQDGEREPIEPATDELQVAIDDFRFAFHSRTNASIRDESARDNAVKMSKDGFQSTIFHVTHIALANVATLHIIFISSPLGQILVPSIETDEKHTPRARYFEVLRG